MFEILVKSRNKKNNNNRRKKKLQQRGEIRGKTNL
jgi:hypothetical protein